MLWQRVLTALVLIPLVVGGILYLGTPYLAVILALVFLIGADEMARLSRLSAPSLRFAYVAVVAAGLWLSWRGLGAVRIEPVQWVMAGWWTLTTLAMIVRRRPLAVVDGSRPAILILGALVLLAAWISIVSLHASGARGPLLVLCLFVLIWVADSGAYFAGRAFGRRKLSPYVSPGKTWAGAGGAVLGAVIAAALLGGSGVIGDVALWALIGLAVFVTVISIGGDLWESRLKREAGLKDSGSLLPGHGGVLDRIDSLLAAAPVFALGAALIGATA